MLGWFPPSRTILLIAKRSAATLLLKGPLQQCHSGQATEISNNSHGNFFVKRIFGQMSQNALIWVQTENIINKNVAMLD